MYKWWFIKVACGTITIAYVLLVTIVLLPYQRFFICPLSLAQLVVMFGSLVHLGHYYLIQKNQNEQPCGTVLVTAGGLFSLIRHPMYLGDMIIMIGMFLFVVMYRLCCSL